MSRQRLSFHLEVSFVPLPPERAVAYRLALGRLAEMLLEAERAEVPIETNKNITEGSSYEDRSERMQHLS